VHQMRQDAADFSVKHTDELATPRHFDAQHALNGQSIGMLLVHRCHIVEAIEIGQRLKIGLVLDQLFGAAVKQANMRINALDELAVEFQNQTKHTVRGRVHGAEVDGEIANV